ncbi:MAG: hypothetical protein F6K19_41475 [Cyanothece sp. SIO1E1]|nr:hypothetical protein [Cyanothece sp. SIO1E1]
MSVPFIHSVQEVTYQKVADYLTASNLFKDAIRIRSDRPQFNLLYGSTMVEIEVLNWDIHPWEASAMAIVKASSCSNSKFRM